MITDPAPPRAMPIRWKLPKLTLMTLVPWLWICSSIAARTPEPSAIITITKATPMITPSIMSAERILFRQIALPAIRSVFMIVMSRLRLEGRQNRALGNRVPPLSDDLVADHPAVAEHHHPAGVLRDVVLVDDQNHT